MSYDPNSPMYNVNLTGIGSTEVKEAIKLAQESGNRYTLYVEPRWLISATITKGLVPMKSCKSVPASAINLVQMRSMESMAKAAVAALKALVIDGPYADLSVKPTLPSRATTETPVNSSVVAPVTVETVSAVVETVVPVEAEPVKPAKVSRFKTAEVAPVAEVVTETKLED